MPSMLPLLYTSEKREISARHSEANTAAELDASDREFNVNWVVHRHESQPVAVERSALQDLDEIVETCRGRFPEMRHKHPNTPPDGFLVLDRDGNEVRR